MSNLILDWNEYTLTARQAVAEGCVLLENNGVLPLKTNSVISIFGRIQNHYYKSGTGSGGMVNVAEVISIPDGLRRSGVLRINEELFKVYEEWEEEHPFNEGLGWGQEPWSQEEMPLTDEIVQKAAGNSDAAIVIIGRTAGEDRDATDTPGSNKLTELEEAMLSKVRNSFEKMVVLLNVGGIMDMSFVETYKPDAVMYVWQGGMVGGDGTADVLVGKTSPSGKLTDTIAYHVSDHLSDKNFGGDDVNVYEEDIYVGYRYFETFAKDRVRYPFGYGLSYTSFETKVNEVRHKVLKADDVASSTIDIEANVTNTGKLSGKEVVQVYVGAPQAAGTKPEAASQKSDDDAKSINGSDSKPVLGKPERVLAGFAKTKLLAPGESEKLTITINPEDFASYDDEGLTGFPYCKVLEKGTYRIYVGTDVRSAVESAVFTVGETCVVEKLARALTPVRDCKRYVAATGDDGKPALTLRTMPSMSPDEDKRREEYMPKEIAQTGDKGLKLCDVLDEKCTMDEFIAQLSDDDLTCIVRGEGMGSSKVTPGTAAAFGGASDSLVGFGIPAACCDDGPSGMRLDSGVKAFSLPNGTMLAAAFNPELIEKLYSFTGLEMISNKVECLLGPGINIHRHPLNGRNFEYFSEDPFVTGVMAAAVIKGLHKYGVTGTIKHFCANNQEHRRSLTDSVVSERALREIYLRPFEMAVKLGEADSVMTTYGSLNGLWTAGNFDLNTTVLRKQWGFKGIVMTDWWAAINERDKKQAITNYAQMLRAQNDLYMVCSDSSRNADGDNLMTSLQDGSLTRAELQRSAVNICEFVMKTHAMKRLLGTAETVEILNKPVCDDDVSLDGVEFVRIEGEKEIRLDDRDSVKGTNYIIPLDLAQTGNYRISLSGSSALSRVAQIPCTLFNTGTPVATFSFTGTGSEEVTIERNVEFFSRFSTMRLFVARNGVKLTKIKLEYLSKGDFIDGCR